MPVTDKDFALFQGEFFLVADKSSASGTEEVTLVDSEDKELVVEVGNVQLLTSDQKLFLLPEKDFTEEELEEALKVANETRASAPEPEVKATGKGRGSGGTKKKATRSSQLDDILGI